MRNRLLLGLLALLPFTAVAQRVNLAGEWSLQYGDTHTTIMLPGTMDTNKQGVPISKKDETTHLSRL